MIVASELLGSWNWWAPKPLRRLHDRIGLRESGPGSADRAPAAPLAEGRPQRLGWLGPMNCGGFDTSSRRPAGSSTLELVSTWTGALPGLASPGRASKEHLLRRPEGDLNLDRDAGWCGEAEDLASAVMARDRRVPGV